MAEPALHLVESPDNNYSGFGRNVVKLTNQFGSVVCLIGEHDMVWFPRPCTFEELQAVSEILHKKKMRKALNHQDFQKAQDFANKKFGQ